MDILALSVVQEVRAKLGTLDQRRLLSVILVVKVIVATWVIPVTLDPSVIQDLEVSLDL